MSCKIVLTNYNSPFIIGTYVVGKVTCDIKTPEVIRGITIKLRGLEWVQWTRNKQTISAKNKFLKQDIQLANEGQLSAGLHDFSFSFMLPLNIPTSFTGRYGWIIYSLIAKVDRPRKLNYKHTLRIPVISPIDLDLVIDKSVLRPFGFEDEKTLCCGCCSKGQIAVDVRLDKKVFVPGEIIKIKVRVTNQTNEKITKVKVYFRMDVRSTVKVVLGKSFIDDRTLIAKTKDGGVGARDEKHFELLLPLPMFDAVPNFLNCELLSIVSGIEVVCVLPPLHCNMRTFVPVHLADIPLGGLNDYVARIKNTEVFTGKKKSAGHSSKDAGPSSKSDEQQMIFRTMGKFSLF